MLDSIPDAPQAIPNFVLYGESAGETEFGFIHVESIPARSSLHNWEIQPHRHDGLHQFFLVTAGEGRVRIDGAERRLRAPAFLSIPALVVHGFRFDRDIGGTVLTASQDILAAALAGLQDPGLSAAMSAPLMSDLSRTQARRRALEAAFVEVEEEFRWRDLGARSAVTALLMLMIVTAARLHRSLGEAASRPSPDMLLVDRLRHLMEAHLCEHWPVGRFARTLGATESRLNRACRRITGQSVLQLLHGRLLLEAKRNLVYTSMRVSEVAYALGFEDPAYFSRFFLQREGKPPLAFRRDMAARPGVRPAPED